VRLFSAVRPAAHGPILAAAFAIVLGSAGVSAGVPGHLVITGNSRLSLDALTRALDKVSCDRLDSTCVARTCSLLAETYWDAGYLGAEVRCDRPSAPGDTVRVSIVEGVPSFFESLRTEGMPAEDSTAARAIFESQLGRPFSRARLEAGLDEVLSSYDARGYPLASIAPELEATKGSGIAVLLRVRRGPKATLKAVHFVGLGKTKEQAALRETGLRPGEAYDGARIETAREKLLRLGIFEDVSDARLAFDARDTTVSVAFDVAEARTGIFEGVVAYSPSTARTRFVGSFNLELNNLGGTLRQAKVHWMRTGRDRLAWDLYYREPRIAGEPFALEGSITSDVVDTSYARRRFWAGVTFVGEPRLEIGTGAFLGSTKDRAALGGEGDFKEKGLSFHLSYEGRRRPINPQSGEFFDLSQEVEALTYSGGEARKRTLSSVKASAEYILPFGVSTNLAGRVLLDGVRSSSGRVPPSHLVKLGGMATLRGYPEEWFTATEAVALSLELRRLLGPYSRVYVFLDGATLDDETHDLGTTRDLPFGYGFGLMAGSSGGVLRIEIALGRHDTWSDAKLHLGLVQRF
jgi:translocation and assembly module TamA